MNLTMKMQVDSWVEHVIYHVLENCRKRNVYPSPEEIACLMPLIHLYQARQTELLTKELEYLWRVVHFGINPIEVNVMQVQHTKGADSEFLDMDHERCTR